MTRLFAFIYCGSLDFLEVFAIPVPETRLANPDCTAFFLRNSAFPGGISLLECALETCYMRRMA